MTESEVACPSHWHTAPPNTASPRTTDNRPPATRRAASCGCGASGIPGQSQDLGHPLGGPGLKRSAGKQRVASGRVEACQFAGEPFEPRPRIGRGRPSLTNQAPPRTNVHPAASAAGSGQLSPPRNAPRPGPPADRAGAPFAFAAAARGPPTWPGANARNTIDMRKFTRDPYRRVVAKNRRGRALIAAPSVPAAPTSSSCWRAASRARSPPRWRG